MNIQTVVGAWFAGEYSSDVFVDPPRMMIGLPDGGFLLIGDGDVLHCEDRSEVELLAEDPESVYGAALTAFVSVTRDPIRDAMFESLSGEITLLRTVVANMADQCACTENVFLEGTPEKAAFRRALAEPRNQRPSEEWDNPEGLTLNGDGRP